MNKKISTTISLLTLLSLPIVAYGAGLIPCGDPIIDGVTTATTHPCAFNDLITLANSIVHFLMYDVAMPLVALGFMYTGARMVLFQNKEEEVSAGKERLMDVVKGLGMILGAYVLIKFILFTFLNTDAGFTLFLLQ